MTSFSVCFWVQLIYASGSTVTLLSYSNSVYEKAFLLDTQGVTINIYMDDDGQLYPTLDLKDEKWHHVCILLDQIFSNFSFYFDGVHTTLRSFRREKILKGGGTLLIGARRTKSIGQITHRMSGRFSNLNIWDRYLTEDDLHKVHRSCDLNRGNVMYWCEHVIAPMLRNNVSIVSSSTECSALYADASFTRQASFKLTGHEITQTTVRDDFTCALYCLRNCSCQSFNLSKQSHNQYICELNKATDKQFPGDLVFMADDDVTYHTMLTLH
ncbi:pentraxin fusion protein-like [Orbicella faveolata]|uniref:pentraxin fusion protein-like n=1 Tax=Orbicella faveolata TaxID=48498 RepID=UPI0009E4365C|nr:pentraxin fusion protein-like [Orbicella faveolata]